MKFNHHSQPGQTSSTPRSPRLRQWQIIAAALFIPILFDRALSLAFHSQSATGLIIAMIICWSVLLMAITALFCRYAWKQPFWWFTLTASLALLTWLAVFLHSTGDANEAYRVIVLLIALPSLLMLHLELGAGHFDAFRPGSTARSWLVDWLVRPFSHLAKLPDAIRSLRVSHRSDQNNPGQPAGRSTSSLVLIALAIGIPILTVLMALLSSADMVFAQTLAQVLSALNHGSILIHIVIILCSFPLLFSLFASIDERRMTTRQNLSFEDAAAGRDKDQHRPFNGTVVIIVLAMVLLLYAVFIGIQFTFLFAGAGLPDGYTYAEYAREGFFQLIVVACVNLVGFALVLTYASAHRTITGMLATLVAATAAILVSAARRLSLYIVTYGLTPLRFISMAFILLLAAILAMSVIRLATKKMPWLTWCFVCFVLWFAIVGFVNPSHVIEQYNETHGSTIACCTPV